MNDMLTHLATSTAVLAVALLVARFAPLTARTRYAVLLCGLAKFAIPSTLIGRAFRAAGISQSPGVVSMQWLGRGLSVAALTPQPASRWPETLAVAWIVPAVVLAMLWMIARQRLVLSALRARSNASQREQAALAAARRQLGLRTSVEVTRSAICEAPAVVRIIRPVIVLPDGGCDPLDDCELESLLRHECAHIARNDNLVSLGESAIVAAFWFHPLIWIAQRAIATAREEACDEKAAASTEDVDTYVSALTKICRSVLASRLAGVSCMASAHLKERLNHIMSYNILRKRALSHRLVLTVAVSAFVAITLGGALQAVPSSDAKQTPYKLNFFIRPAAQAGMLVFHGRVIETSTDQLLAQPSVTFKRGSTAHVSSVADDRDIQIDIRDVGEKVSAVMRVLEKGVQQQETTYYAVPQTDRPRESRYTGEPISLNLKDADLKNVLDTFAKLTNTKIEYAPTLEGKVTIHVTDMPWDEAFETILRVQHLTWQMKGKTIVIEKE